MTDQMPDRLRVGQCRLAMRENPLCSAKMLGLELPNPKVHCSGLWRKHVAHWVLQNGRLVLESAQDARQRMVPLSDLHSLENPMWAHWYSGPTEIPDRWSFHPPGNPSGWCLWWEKGALASVWRLEDDRAVPSSLDALQAHFEGQGTLSNDEDDGADDGIPFMLVRADPDREERAPRWFEWWRKGKGRPAQEAQAARVCQATEQPVLKTLNQAVGAWDRAQWQACGQEDALARLAPPAPHGIGVPGGLLAPQWKEVQEMHRAGDQWVAFAVPLPRAGNHPATLEGLGLLRGDRWVARWVHGIAWEAMGA